MKRYGRMVVSAVTGEEVCAGKCALIDAVVAERCVCCVVCWVMFLRVWFLLACAPRL